MRGKLLGYPQIYARYFISYGNSKAITTQKPPLIPQTHCVYLKMGGVPSKTILSSTRAVLL